MLISTIVGRQCTEQKVCKMWTEFYLHFIVWRLLHLSPSPSFPNLVKGSKHLFLTQHEKLQTDVYLSMQRECRALSHTDEKPWKSLCCVFSVLRQCLSLVGWRKQSHRFLILIPFYCFSPIDYLSILNEMEGSRDGGLLKGKTFPAIALLSFNPTHLVSVCLSCVWSFH